MAYIFKNQTNQTLNIDTLMDLSNATVHQILYKKPKGKKGFFVATVNGSVLSYAAQTGDFDELGEWEFQGFVTIGGLDSYTSILKVLIIDNLK